MCLLDVSTSMAKNTPDGQTRMEHAVKAVDLFVQQKVKCRLMCEINVRTTAHKHSVGRLCSRQKTK